MAAAVSTFRLQQQLDAITHADRISSIEDLASQSVFFPFLRL